MLVAELGLQTCGVRFPTYQSVLYYQSAPSMLCAVRECDSQCLGLQGQGCMQGRVQGRGGWGLVASWKEKETWQAEAWIPQPSLGNISDIFQPRVSGQAGIYGSAVSHDDLGGAELCVTPD